MRARPLSPHLGIYRFIFTMATSIAHRVTGVILSIGLPLLVWWLMAAATGPTAYARAQRFLGSLPVKLLLAGWLLAFAYHLCNGIRHLTFDLGFGLERAEARRSAGMMVAAALIIAAALIYLAFGLRGAR
jgi:succinate dehydrogenase / fumarate reductase cytochrome b subunit